MSHVLLVTVPNNRESPEKTFAAVQNVVTASSYSTMSKIEVPNLVVGTLDTLMSLADELGKIGTVIEVGSTLYFPRSLCEKLYLVVGPTLLFF